jgi:hypothetical protein
MPRKHGTGIMAARRGTGAPLEHRAAAADHIPSRAFLRASSTSSISL